MESLPHQLLAPICPCRPIQIVEVTWTNARECSGEDLDQAWHVPYFSRCIVCSEDRPDSIGKPAGSLSQAVVRPGYAEDIQGCLCSGERNGVAVICARVSNPVVHEIDNL